MAGHKWKPGESGNPKGRPQGAVSALAKRDREKAAETGLLPHEILLEFARGGPIQQKRIDEHGKVIAEDFYPDPKMRQEAAAAAAPYYAPRLSAQKVDMSGDLAIRSMTDAELDARLTELVTKCKS